MNKLKIEYLPVDSIKPYENNTRKRGVRKSKKIGTAIKGFLVIDSRHKNKDVEYFVRCQNCGNEAWKSSGFLKAKAICPQCEGGVNFRNAQGYTNERLYERYRAILRRVYSKEKYIGVTICKEWENDYLAFREWALNNGYKDELTIDRIDNSKGYSPENCRWATPKEQANNRNSNVYIEYEGTRYTLSQLADHVGVSRSTIQQRRKNGWSVEDIVKTPYKSRKKWSEING